MRFRRSSALLLAIAISAARLGAQQNESKLDLRPIAMFNQHLYAGELGAPRGLAFDRENHELWVIDSRDGTVGVFDPEGFPLFSFSAPKQLQEPVRAAIDGKGQLLVIDGNRKAIRVFSYRGEYRGDLKLPGAGEKPVFGAIAVDDQGNLFVGENGSAQVLVYDRELNLKRRFGARGSEEGQFQSFAGIAVHGDEIFVLDHQVLAVQVFDRRGNFLRGWGRHEMGAEHFSLPEGIAVDSKGHVIVVDALRHEIKFFDLEGNFVKRFGGMGKRLGSVMFPSDVVVDEKDHVYVADRANGRIQVFEQLN